MKNHMLVVANIAIAILLLINLELRMSILGIMPQDWGISGCPTPRNVEYTSLEYGDEFRRTLLHDINNTPVPAVNEGHVTHLVLVPYISMRLLESLSFLNTWAQHKNVRTVIIIYKPEKQRVSGYGWKYAYKWGEKQEMFVVVDEPGEMVTDMHLFPCECIYQVIISHDGIIKWAESGFLGDNDLRDLLLQYASDIELKQ